MNNENFEEFLLTTEGFKIIYAYADNQDLCDDYPLEQYYPDMKILYSTHNQYFPLILLNKKDEIFLLDRENELVELEDNIYYLPFYLFKELHMHNDKISARIDKEDEKKYFHKYCESLKKFFKMLKERNIEMKNLEEAEKIITDIELFWKNI